MNNFGQYGYPYGAQPSQVDRYANVLGQFQPQSQPQQQSFQPQMNNQFQQPATQGVIPVASIEEVKAHPVDWSGNANYFVDNVNNRIYTKQVGLDGIPRTNIYKLDNEPVVAPQTEYVTREEFDVVNNTLNSLLKQLGGDTISE